MKLTKPQKELLRDICDYDVQLTINTYKPALKLVELGYATSEPERWGRIKLTATNAGRKALEEQ